MLLPGISAAPGGSAQETQPPAEPLPLRPAIGEEELRKARQLLMKYKAGKAAVERRVIASQNWWKLKNWEEIRNVQGVDEDKPASAWLWSAIVGKHADSMENFPEPVILPRAMDDRREAESLSKIVPVAMAQNHFGDTYDEVQLQKAVEGTGVYGCFWDKTKLGGMGDITIEKIEVLNLFWEPGIKDIQKSAHLFHCEMADREELEDRYPQARGRLGAGRGSGGIVLSRYQTDDSVRDENKVLVVDWYYHRYRGGRKILHLCKFAGDVVLESTENDPRLRERGLYDDGEYPFVFDVLYRVAGSPCGYGYVDVAKDTQTSIDIVNQALVKNAAITATPRFFINTAAKINEEEFADWSNPFVHTEGAMGGDAILPISVSGLNGSLLNFMEQKKEEIKFVTGNMDVQNGGTTGGVTSATGLMAQMEAAGRSSKDANRTSHRAYARLVNMVIERIRQFYDVARQYRITGQDGQEDFVSYSNAGLKPQWQGEDFGVDMGYRLPVFDIDVQVQKQAVYTKLAQNDLAIQLFQLGMFNPQMTDQALAVLDMMDFKGKEELMRKLQENGTMAQALAQYQQIALALASKYEPDIANQLGQQIMMTSGAQATVGQAEAGGTAAGTLEDSSITKKARGGVQNAVSVE